MTPSNVRVTARTSIISPTENGARLVSLAYVFSKTGKILAIYQSQKAVLFHAAQFSRTITAVRKPKITILLLILC